MGKCSLVTIIDKYVDVVITRYYIAIKIAKLRDNVI